MRLSPSSVLLFAFAPPSLLILASGVVFRSREPARPLRHSLASRQTVQRLDSRVTRRSVCSRRGLDQRDWLMKSRLQLLPAAGSVLSSQQAILERFRTRERRKNFEAFRENSLSGLSADLANDLEGEKVRAQ